MSTRPTQAVSPGIPRTPSAVDGGATSGSSLRSCFASAIPPSRQPSPDRTQSPSAKPGSFDATTRPTDPPSIASPTSYGSTYVRMPLMRLRMYGSTETKTFRTTTSPAAGSRSSTSRNAKSDSFGAPCGRAASTTSRVFTVPAPTPSTRLRSASPARRPIRARPSSSRARRRPGRSARSAGADGRCRRSNR